MDDITALDSHICIEYSPVLKVRDVIAGENPEKRLPKGPVVKWDAGRIWIAAVQFEKATNSLSLRPLAGLLSRTVYPGVCVEKWLDRFVTIRIPERMR